MKSIVCGCIFLALAGCATTLPESADQSVFDVIDEAEMMSPRSVDFCPSGGVVYCVGDGSTNKRCGCADPFDVQRDLERLF